MRPSFSQSYRPSAPRPEAGGLAPVLPPQNLPSTLSYLAPPGTSFSPKSILGASVQHHNTFRSYAFSTLYPTRKLTPGLTLSEASETPPPPTVLRAHSGGGCRSALILYKRPCITSQLSVSQGALLCANSREPRKGKLGTLNTGVWSLLPPLRPRS